jgi:hypothetical protein
MKRRSSLFLGGGAVIILAVGCFLFEQAFLDFPDIQPPPPPKGEVLSPASLASDERIVIDYRIDGCRGGYHWIFQLTGAPDRRLAIIDAGDSWGGDRFQTGKPEPIGALVLSDTDCRGVQDLIACFRKEGGQHNSTAFVSLKLEYFRGLEKIGEESFTDDGSIDRSIYDRDHAGESPWRPKIIISPEMLSLPQLVQRAAEEANGE